MVLRILKKDLKRKRGVNVILFLFIVIATIFLASSWNNMLVVQNGTKYFLDVSNMPDEYIVNQRIGDDHRMDDWIRNDNPYLDSYGYQEALMLSPKSVKLVQDNELKDYETKSSIYIQTNPTEYVKVFDVDGNPIQVNKGEVAIAIAESNRKNVGLGDLIEVSNGNETRRLKISCLVKDALFGGESAGMIRLIVNEEDYNFLREGTECSILDNYFVFTHQKAEFTKEYNKQQFTGNNNMIDRNMVELMYVMEIVIAGLLTIIGVCLIAMAVLVLRFTIVFTIEEEYREIGIMKAIGIKNFGVKKIYMIKYFVLVTVGAILGCIISFPVGNFMLKGVTTTMLMEDSSNNGIYNILCAFLVIVLVLGLCYLSMRKLNRLSAIEAIRSGETGERYHKKSMIRLHNRRRLNLPCFLSLNDILSNIKRYVVLLLVFAMGIVLIIVPLNTLNTMTSPYMAEQFLLDGKANLYMSRIEAENATLYQSETDLEEGLDKITEKFLEHGYDVKFTSAALFFLPYRVSGNEETCNELTLQPVNSDGSYLTYTNGTAPVLPNEIAMSNKVLDKLGIQVGDSVITTIDNQEKTFIVTGSYQDYMQLGKSVRMNTAIDLTNQSIYDYWTVQLYVNKENSPAIKAGSKAAKNNSALLEQMKEEFPEYVFSSAQDIVNNNVGGIMNTLDGMRLWLVLLISGLDMLITVLMMKMFIMREKGEIAMLRSIGFRNRTIRLWQTIRIAALLVVSLVLAIPLSKLMDYIVLRPVFGIMGADMKIFVKPFEVYLCYPGILLIAIVAAAAVCSRSIKKVDIREMSNLE